MGKGSNACKNNRARADAAKRAAEEGKGGGGQAGMKERAGATPFKCRACMVRPPSPRCTLPTLVSRHAAVLPRDLASVEHGLLRACASATPHPATPSKIPPFSALPQNQFAATSREAILKVHVDAKHVGKSFAECFPDYEEVLKLVLAK